MVSENVDTVVINNEKRGYMAVKHLINYGHKRVAILSSTPQFFSFEERQKGYEKALLEHSLELDDALIKVWIIVALKKLENLLSNYWDWIYHHQQPYLQRII